MTFSAFHFRRYLPFLAASMISGFTSSGAERISTK